MVRREPFMMDRIDVVIASRRADHVAFASPVVYCPQYGEGGFVPPPTFSLEPEAAQQLIDELWRSGLRPTEGTGSAGSLAATERHLEDMRALVFKTQPKR